MPGALHGVGHNFLHQRDSWWMYACVVGGWNVHLNRVALERPLKPLVPSLYYKYIYMYIYIYVYIYICIYIYIFIYL